MHIVLFKQLLQLYLFPHHLGLTKSRILVLALLSLMINPSLRVRRPRFFCMKTLAWHAFSETRFKVFRAEKAGTEF